MARGVARSTRGGQGRRRIVAVGGDNVGRRNNRMRRFFTPEQLRGDFTDTRSRRTLLREATERRRGLTPATGNAGGGSTSGDPHQNRGSRRAASAATPAPAVRPRPSEARAARGQLIRQIATRRQNARRSQRAT